MLLRLLVVVFAVATASAAPIDCPQFATLPEVEAIGPEGCRAGPFMTFSQFAFSFSTTGGAMIPSEENWRFAVTEYSWAGFLQIFGPPAYAAQGQSLTLDWSFQVHYSAPNAELAFVHGFPASVGDGNPGHRTTLTVNGVTRTVESFLGTPDNSVPVNGSDATVDFSWTVFPLPGNARIGLDNYLLFVTTDVPEPASFALLTLGAVGCLALRLYRRVS